MGRTKRKQQQLTPTIPRIIFRNTFTLFNIILFILATAIVAVGRPEHALFIGVIICNMGTGAFQEIKAKRALDHLAILAKGKVKVIRDEEAMTISQDDVMVGDTVVLGAGNQVSADGMVVSSHGLELDESLLTGESDHIAKNEDDMVFSGSFVVSGQGKIKVTAVGEDSYAQTLTTEAKQGEKEKPKLLRTLNRMIMVLTFILIPLGAALFYMKYFDQREPLEIAILGAAASMTGMIPSGLVLLTGVTMTVGALKLAKRKALVQSLGSIETLARADVICLDKTGTITDGSLGFQGLELRQDISAAEVRKVLQELLGTLADNNATAVALTNTFGNNSEWTATIKQPFSSERKWSGVTFSDQGTYLMGAPGMLFYRQSKSTTLNSPVNLATHQSNFLTFNQSEGEECDLSDHQGEDEFLRKANEYAAKGNRVLALAYSAQPLVNHELPTELTCLALLILTDNIRENAADTFRYFAAEEVTLKVISGDNPHTVSFVAGKAGIENAHQFIDMKQVDETADYAEIANNYTVFGHVTPRQKRELVRGLKAKGHTACMTGDGVNDILAMREADCSVAMVTGSDAARTACDFVLMADDFSAMIDVLKEGRRIVNNIERVAAIFLLKTIYTMILTACYLILPYAFPMTPLQMMPINAFTVAFPSFFLSLQESDKRPANRLFPNIMEYTLPAALTVVINTLILQWMSDQHGISYEEITTKIVFMIGIMSFYLLFRMAKPCTRLIGTMLAAMVTGYVLTFVFFGRIVALVDLFNRNAIYLLPLLGISFVVYHFLSMVCRTVLLRVKFKKTGEA